MKSNYPTEKLTGGRMRNRWDAPADSSPSQSHYSLRKSIVEVSGPNFGVSLSAHKWQDKRGTTLNIGGIR